MGVFVSAEAEQRELPVQGVATKNNPLPDQRLIVKLARLIYENMNMQPMCKASFDSCSFSYSYCLYTLLCTTSNVREKL